MNLTHAPYTKFIMLSLKELLFWNHQFKNAPCKEEDSVKLPDIGILHLFFRLKIVSEMIAVDNEKIIQRS